MFTPFIFWPWFSGLVFLFGGLFLVRKNLAAAPGLEKLIVLGPVIYAVPLAAFGAEHIAGAQILKQMIPDWIPGHLFWAYFVGFALLAAAISILFDRYVGWSGTLLGIMLFLFVILLHIPRLAVHRNDRFSWLVVFRDSSFGAAAWALAGSRNRQWRLSRPMIAVGRYCLAISLIFFAVETFLHPTALPGIPLERFMGSWVPLPALWGYITGAFLLAAGVALLLRKKDRMAAACTGLLIILLVVCIYLPDVPRASKPDEMIDIINYIADTLFFAGAILVVGETSRSDH